MADISAQWRGMPRRHITTAAVLDEIKHHGLPVAGLDWLEMVHVDGLKEITALFTWMGRASGQDSNQGEATVLAWADVHGALPVIDDRDARRAARNAGLQVWGSLRVVAEPVKDGRVTEYAATALVDALLDTGIRYPFPRGGFITWAKHNSLF